MVRWYSAIPPYHSTTPPSYQLLPPLLLGFALLPLAYWLLRGKRKVLAGGVLLVGLVVIGLTLTVFAQDVRQIQAKHDLFLLLSALSQPGLYAREGLRDTEESLFFFSVASQALYRAADYAPERRGAIDSALLRMAEWTVRPGILRQWRGGTADWDDEVYFLAHASAVLGHHQIVTGNERYADRFKNMSAFLRHQLQRTHYKHLPSRPREDLLRPADNAAAVYALTLYDAYYGDRASVNALTEWAGYLERELHYAESRLPCAGFTATNRCSLEPTATATGLYICYRAAATPGAEESDIPYREWLHYFKRFSGSPFHLSIRPNMRRGEVARQCNAGASPLECGRYEDAIGLWAAAEYGGSYTHFRLLAGYMFERWFGQTPDYDAMRPARRVEALTEVAIRLLGEA